ncbi:hypothetical protein NFI96_026292 [Prochilodus magdalenae]|nr:hypothetical protein NFI96_026292 [Prochilodus magdalenae]
MPNESVCGVTIVSAKMNGPEGLVPLHLHPYRTICRNCVRLFKLCGMDHRTPLGTTTAPYRDVLVRASLRKVSNIHQLRDVIMEEWKKIPVATCEALVSSMPKRQLRRLHPRKAAGPDRVCPRMLKACAAQLGEPLQHVFNLSLRLGRVPATWKTTCLIPVPKKAHPKELNDYRPVALTSHVMKTMERLLLNHLRPQVHHAEDPLQFAYREKVGVEDAILYLLHRIHSHLDKGGCAVRVMFFDFSSAFNTIQPLLLRDKLMKMEVDMHLVTWITDYLTGRPQHVRIRGLHL